MKVSGTETKTDEAVLEMADNSNNKEQLHTLVAQLDVILCALASSGRTTGRENNQNLADNEVDDQHQKTGQK